MQTHSPIGWCHLWFSTSGASCYKGWLAQFLPPKLLHCFQQSCLQEKSLLRLSQNKSRKVNTRSIRRNMAWLGLEKADFSSCLCQQLWTWLWPQEETWRSTTDAPAPTLFSPPKGLTSHDIWREVLQTLYTQFPIHVVSRLRQSCKQDMAAAACSSVQFY